jgi:hypothetical protein
MTGRGIDPTLQTSVEQVTTWWIRARSPRRSRSWMLVAAESGHGAIRTEEDEAVAG